MSPSGWSLRLEFAAKCFVWTAFLGSLVAAGMRLRANAVAAPEQTVDLSRWRVAERPDWMSLDDVAVVRDAAALDGTTISLRDREAVAAVRGVLGSAPTVRRVLSVRRRQPDSIVATIEVRRPVVAVRVQRAAPRAPTQIHGAGSGSDGRGARVPPPVSALAVPPRPVSPLTVRYLEVDADAVVLRADLKAIPVRSERALPVVMGATPVNAPGDVLGAGVRAAAALVRRFERAAVASHAPDAPTIARIDISNFGGRVSPLGPEVILWVRQRGHTAACPVEWGRIEGFHTDAAEPAFTEKRRHLQRALARYPRLAGLAAVKVAFGDLVVVPNEAVPGESESARRDGL